MRTEMRLKRIEEATGINEPCEVCDHLATLEPRIKELAARLGVHLSEAFGPEMPSYCYYCLRVERRKVGEFNVSERVLHERLHTAFEDGMLCAPENSTLREEFLAACDRVSQLEWGEHFAALRVLTEEFGREFERTCARSTPRWMYLCRVPGCGCAYPKTEEEWRNNARAKGLELPA